MKNYEENNSIRDDKCDIPCLITNEKRKVIL